MSARGFVARAAALLLALSGAAAHAVQDCDLHGERVNPANGNTTQGKTGVMRCKDRDSGELQREQELRNGVFMGAVRYYDRGKLAKEHSVNAKGNLHGRAREFYPDGQVLREATYDDGHEVGLVRSFHPNGQLRRVAFYADPGGERASAEFTPTGQLSALRCADKAVLAPAADDARLCGFSGSTPSQVELFDAKGGLRARLAFVAGKRVRSERLYDNGKPESIDELAGNQRIEQRFSSEGVKRYELTALVVERGSVKQREAEYSERGSLVREQRWNPAGAALSDNSFYLNGQPRSTTVYSGEGLARVADITEFHDNGQRAAQGRFSAPAPRGRLLPVGLHRRFDDAGRLQSESAYDDKGRVMRERTWDANGQPDRDDEVFPDGSRRAYAK
jgi:antitoxin component YwqK of YwqJK toxin-antitoxin module